jgi:hypothetical protein
MNFKPDFDGFARTLSPNGLRSDQGPRWKQRAWMAMPRCSPIMHAAVEEWHKAPRAETPE